MLSNSFLPFFLTSFPFGASGAAPRSTPARPRVTRAAAAERQPACCSSPASWDSRRRRRACAQPGSRARRGGGLALAGLSFAARTAALSSAGLFRLLPLPVPQPHHGAGVGGRGLAEPLPGGLCGEPQQVPAEAGDLGR